MPAAGETIIAGRVSGERIATTIVTSNSGTVTTTETTVISVVAPVVAGRTYRVRAMFATQQSVATDTHVSRIREDNATGTQLQGLRIGNEITNNAMPQVNEGEYTADATEDKTFVLTLVRSSGTGNVNLYAAATTPSYLYVDYIRG